MRKKLFVFSSLFFGLSLSLYSCFNNNIQPNDNVILHDNVILPPESFQESESAFSQLPVCQVKEGSIYDGDTLRVFCEGEEKRIRFACVDTPEINPSQAYGIESRDFLRELLAQADMQVQVDEVDIDRYGRTIAELWIDRSSGWESVPVIQATNGTAWAYEQYKHNCKSWDEVYSAQSAAQQQDLGLWEDDDAIPPWEFRRQ